MRKLLLSLALIAALAGVTTSALAQDKKATTNTPAGSTNLPAFPRMQRMPFRGTVASVDAVTKTVTLQGEKKQSMMITPQTRIIKDGKMAAFDAIAPGLKVQGQCSQTSSGKWEATTFKIVEMRAPTPVPPPASAPAPKAQQ